MTRQRWSSRLAFVLAAVGSAVGLGNVWRFPYLAGKYGGGAFLIPYLLAFVIVGVPLLMLELAIGQKMQQGPIRALNKLHPAFGGLGLMAVGTGFLVVSYYAVVMAWCLIYFFQSFGVAWADNSEAYFFEQVLQLSEGTHQLGGFNIPVLLALAAVWLMIYFSLWQGPKSVERVVRYTVPVPVIVLVILFVRAVTLPGFWQGWQLYLTPVWSVLFAPEVWTAACTQIFYTLSLAFAIMLTYASYKDENEDIAKDAWLTGLINSGISLFAGFVVFAVLGYMAWVSETPVADLAASGPGLAFVVFPEALSLMPLAGLFSALFFLMLLTLGIDSAFSLLEPAIAAIRDRYNQWSIARVAAGMCLLAFGAGLIYTTRAGLYFLDIVDHFVTSYNLLIIGIVQAVLGGWIVGAESLRRYINQVSDWPVGRWWNVSIRWVVPLVLTGLLVSQLATDWRTPYEGYPAWALSIGWGAVLVPLAAAVWMIRGNRSGAEPSRKISKI